LRVEDRQLAELCTSIEDLAEQPAGIFGSRLRARYEHGLTYVTLRSEPKLFVLASLDIDLRHPVVEPAASDVTARRSFPGDVATPARPFITALKAARGPKK
jgi:hypothetical protein